MSLFTGMKYFLDQVGVQTTQVQAAFSFYQNQRINTNSVYSDPWATSASSGILNKEGTGQFFNYSGTGYFNGSAYMKLSSPYTFDNDTILLSYEKLRAGDEILMSSATGTNFTNYSGFCVGINDANKFYFKYWNPVEGPFTFTYSQNLANKNLMILNRNGNVLTIGSFNNNSLQFENEVFNIKNNAFTQSNNLFLGGMPNNVNWANNQTLNFSGYIDKFFIFKDVPFIYSDKYVSGLIYLNTGSQGYIENNCYTTGYFSGFQFPITGVSYQIIPFNITGTGITGSQIISTGYSYSGVTGYQSISLGFYNYCSAQIEIFGQSPLSGLITNSYSGIQYLTGLIITTGYIQSGITGVTTGIENRYITGQYCEQKFIPSGDQFFDQDLEYLKSLSFSEVSLLSEIKKDTDIIEIYRIPYTASYLDCNNNLNYNNQDNSFFTNTFINDEVLIPQNSLLYCNGQLLMDSGYTLQTIGYDTFIKPILDCYITGKQLYVDELIVEKDSLFYDYLSNGSITIVGLPTGASPGDPIPISNSYNSNRLVFLNGVKLVRGVDYTSINPANFNINIPSGNNVLTVKFVQYSNIGYLTGNNSTLTGFSKNLNKNSSIVFYNGIKQQLNNNYVENSDFDLLSGDYYENQNNFIIYNNREDFFV